MNYVQSVDGFGDRPDIALEKDRAWENRITYRDHDGELREKLSHCGEWGAEDCPSIKTAINNAIDNGKSHLVLLKKNYCFDYPDLEAIRYEILIDRGWGCDEFQIINHENNAEYEMKISLLYPEGEASS